MRGILQARLHLTPQSPHLCFLHVKAPAVGIQHLGQGPGGGVRGQESNTWARGQGGWSEAGNQTPGPGAKGGGQGPGIKHLGQGPGGVVRGQESNTWARGQEHIGQARGQESSNTCPGQVSGARCQGPGVRGQGPDVRGQVTGARCQGPGTHKPGQGTGFEVLGRPGAFSGSCLTYSFFVKLLLLVLCSMVGWGELWCPVAWRGGVSCGAL